METTMSPDFSLWMEEAKKAKMRTTTSTTTMETVVEEEFVSDLWLTPARFFGLVYITIGLLAIALNSLVLFSLMKRRKQLTHCYYILIFNFALLDCLKGICSILSATKLLRETMDQWSSILDQYSGLVLRFANIVTIVNLMMITLNEFIYISNPLRYSMLVTKARVISVIILTWVMSGIFVVGTSILQADSRNRGIKIDNDCLENPLSSVFKFKENRTFAECIQYETSSTMSHYVFYLSVVVFCIVGLLFTCCTYFFLIKIISKLVQDDAKLKSELEALTNGNHLHDGEDHNEKKKRRSSHGTAIRRKKYAIVIGSVIVVYCVFLLNYAISQILQVIHLSQNTQQQSNMALKYVCYLFISLHSLLQPLCYFRVKEFRHNVYRSLCGRRLRAASVQFDTLTTSVARRAEV
ncbi:hypothetical protein PRIPAC_85223 [Pristionchus pacificus]|uniref:G protein-coupled receptor n=1 Tax=Pristionchus pacificus TaxID=54126 RepID=A0A2A6C9K5_PRIPA|nr:hypothetical protein PRIPAC_85223 [Pristionchus pacificus]|eukprot:PDM74839.1 G protein-coupled receptor [Pristionchus pacificus]